MSDETYDVLEQAIRDHVADVTDGCIATDWVLLSAAVGAEPLLTRYVDACSETAAHSLEGLLHRAVRKASDDTDEDDDED